MPNIEKDCFSLAIDNISKLGDTDIFPLPFENQVLYDMKTESVGILMAMQGDFQNRIDLQGPNNHSALAPLGYNGFRWATQIDPIWNAYFLGAVLALAPKIESSRISPDQQIVFSHRYSPQDEHLFDREGWRKFQTRSLHLAQEYTHVVTMDIADFYGRVYHHRIENELKYVDRVSGGAISKQIIQLLTKFSNGTSYGLPVGGPAARILSELILNSVDKLILAKSQDLAFVRYADDYRFFANGTEAAHRVIGLMSDVLQRNEGLSLQRSKTRIMSAQEFVTTVTPDDPRPGSAAKFLSLHLHYDPYSPTAEEDYEKLREQLTEFDVLNLLRTELFKGRIDQGLTRRLVSSLKHMDSEIKGQALQSLLANLETLSPITPHVMRAIRDNVMDTSEDVQEDVFEQVRGLIENEHYLSKVEVNLAYMVRVLAQKASSQNEGLLIRLYDSPHGNAPSPSPQIQRDIMLTLARWNATFWLHDRKSHYKQMHEWVARSFIVSSYSLGDAGKHWRGGAKKGFDDFSSLVAQWAGERSQSPTWEIPK